MGLETRCAVRVEDSTGAREDADAKVQLEGDALIVRGPARARVERTAIRAMHVGDGVLIVTHEGGTVHLMLGDAASKWQAKIVEGPKSRVHKLGVKPGMTVTLVDVNDPTLGRELAEAGAVVVDEHLRTGPVDLVLLEIARAKDLERIVSIAASLEGGALWVVHPNGDPDIGDIAIFRVAKEAGLVATKTMSFSTGMSAERLSRPKDGAKPR